MSKTLLITGASSGIGKSTAEHFLQRGWNVVATLRNPEKSTLTPHPQLLLQRLDVTDLPSIEAAVSMATARFGAIDVLVNNAGYALIGPLEAFSPEALHQQFATNVLGLVALTQAVLPNMRARRSGVIINISSIGGRMVFPMTSAYNGTKWAVEGISESLAMELALHGIRVRVVEPGGIDTGFASAIQYTEHPAYEAAMKALKRTYTQQRSLPGPDAVARVIYQAATSTSGRLRYLAKPGPYLALSRLLGTKAWRALMVRELKK